MTDTTTTPEAIRDGMLDQLVAGEHVDPLELLRAEALVDLGDRVDAHQARRQTEAREQARLARLDELRADARAIPAQVARARELYSIAVAALGDLRVAVEDVVQTSGRINRELQRLAPLPADADTGIRVGGRPGKGDVRAFAGVQLIGSDKAAVGPSRVSGDVIAQAAADAHLAVKKALPTASRYVGWLRDS